MKKIRLLAIINAAVLLFHIAVSYLSQAGRTGTNTVSEISAKYPTYFTPAGITFSIWGIIYLALFAFVVFHVIKAFKAGESNPENEVLLRIGWLFTVNNLATIAWLFAWTNDKLLLSVLLILIQLATLVIMHIRLNIHDASQVGSNKFFTQFPLSIYFGWISIATIANISAYLKSIGWSGMGISEPSWAITMIAVAILITIWLINRKKNVVFGLVVIWALYGIILKSKEVSSASYEPIAAVAWAGIGFLSFACLFGLIRNLKVPAKA